MFGAVERVARDSRFGSDCMTDPVVSECLCLFAVRLSHSSVKLILVCDVISIIVVMSTPMRQISFYTPQR